MKKIVLLFSILSMLFVTENAVSQTNTWDGSSGTGWATAANWSLGHIPVATEDVVIPSTPANQPVISGISTPVCKNLTINAGATLSITATTLNNGLLTASGNTTINGALTIGGTLAKTAKLITIGITWGATSAMTGTLGGNIEASGDWEFSNGSAVSMGYCSVAFTGSSNTLLISKSNGSSFSSVTIGKSTGNTVTISSSSTATLNFNNSITVNAGSTLLCQGSITTVLNGNLNNSGHFSFSTGTVSMEKSSGTQTIQVNSGDLFNNLVINGGGTVTIDNYLQLTGNMTIQSGIFDPQGNTVRLFGNWTNSAGASAFVEGTGTVSFAGGNYHQYCSNETFNILEVNKSIGGAFRASGTTVTCAQYDWTAGSIDVLNNGTFTANDLADNGLYGGFYINPGSTINLHQDAAQFIDLGAVLNFNGGGNINIYGGSAVSVWGFNANATLTMNGGILDFKDQGFSVIAAIPYTVGVSMTGGTLRTTGSILINSAAFDPTGGTVEMYGSANRTLEVTNGWLKNFLLNKATGSAVTLNTSLSVKGNFTADNGIFTANNRVISMDCNLNINDEGVFHIGAGTQLKMASDMSILVGNGGLMETHGTLADNAIVTHTAGYYYADIQPGGTISSRYTTFQYSYRWMVGMNGIIDPANAFYHCTFTNFTTSTFLEIVNTQTISLHEVNFPSVPPVSNVSKVSNGGRLTFKDATGPYAGPAYEYDPYNRVDWVSSTPGLWTGEVSSDWYAVQNWDDYKVPVAATNVTIPAGTPFPPQINSGDAYCNNITIQTGASLTIGAGDLNAGGDMTIHGQLAETNTSADIYTAGSVLWESGSTANITSGYFHVQGDWEFRNGSNARLTGGTTYFEGAAISNVLSLEANSAFFNVYNAKTGGSLKISDASTDTLKIDGAFNNQYATSLFYANSEQPLVLKGQLFNTGHIYCPQGTFIFKGTTNIINLNTGDYFYNVIFNSSGNVSLADSLRVEGSLKIYSGTLVSNNHNIRLHGLWANYAGPGGFVTGTSKIVFTGDWLSAVLTDESFYDVEINKTDPDVNTFQIFDSVTVLNDFTIVDGNVGLYNNSRLFVSNNFTIALDAGIRPFGTDAKIYCGNDWLDQNPSATTTAGFIAGTNSTVIFLNTSGIQTINEKCPFNNVIIRGVGTYTRPTGQGITCENLTIDSGTFRNYGYKALVNNDFTVNSGTMRMDLAADSLVVGNDVTWNSGSNDLISAGTILARKNWYFNSGTNATLGTGNTVVINGTTSSLINTSDNNASFGNLVIGKTGGSRFTYINSGDTMRVAGNLTVMAVNGFSVGAGKTKVEGNLDIQYTANLAINENGYLANNHPSFILNGILDVGEGDVLIHGTFELAATGELTIEGGSFTSDAPPSGLSWQYLRGILNLNTGYFNILNNSIYIASTAETNISDGVITCGVAFGTQSSGVFNPIGGTVKMNYPGPDVAMITCASGTWFNDLEIAGKISLFSDITIKDDLLITSGVLDSRYQDIFLEGDWTNNAGPGGFLEKDNAVHFTGSIDANITTNETFYDLVVAKTNTNVTALELADGKSITLSNDLTINDGCLKLNPNTILDIAHNFSMASGSGLNADDTPNINIFMRGNWVDNNVSRTGFENGFWPGSSSTVHFISAGNGFLTTGCAEEEFYDLRISKPGYSFRSNDNIKCSGSLLIDEGTWEDNVIGLHHKVLEGITVNSSGAIQNSVSHNTFEFFGYAHTNINYLSTTGCFHNIIVNKQPDFLVIPKSNLNCLFGGNLTINGGTFWNDEGKRIWVEGDVSINNGGKLAMHSASELVLTNLNSLNVNSGGVLELIGATLRADVGTSYYSLNVNSGGIIGAIGSIFKNTGNNGIYLKPGSLIMDDPYSIGFQECTFQDGASGGTLLRIDNDQTIALDYMSFPANTWGGASNVSKTVNSGQVYMVEFTGPFSGETFDDDPFGRVTWVPVMTASVTAVPSTICSGSSSQLSAGVAGGLPPYLYLWSPATGLSDPNAANPGASPVSTTTYEVTIIDDLGSVVYGNVTVNVLPLLPAGVTITASANPSPPATFVTFTATPVNGGSAPVFQWKVNGIPAGSGISYTYTPLNNDQVTCVMTSNYLCSSGNPATSNTITMMIVNTNTTVNGTVPSPLHPCFDALNTITVAGSGSTFVVENGGSAVMIAGMNIRYLTGTVVQPGGYMHGYITTTNGYCGSLPPAMVAVMSGAGTSEITTQAESSEIRKFAGFIAFPNPTQGVFTITQRDPLILKPVRITITDLHGRVVVDTRHEVGDRHTIDMAGVPAGLYIIRLTGETGSEYIKLVVRP